MERMSIQDMADLMYVFEGYCQLKELFDGDNLYMCITEDEPCLEDIFDEIEDLIVDKSLVDDMNRQEFECIFEDNRLSNEEKAIRMMGIEVSDKDDIPVILRQDTVVEIEDWELDVIGSVSDALRILTKYGIIIYGDVLRGFDEGSEYSEGTVFWNLAHYKNILKRH